MTKITVEELVAREVYYNISILVRELAVNEKYGEDLMSVLVQDDWETPAKENGCKLIHDTNKDTYKISNTSGGLKRSTFYSKETAYTAYCEGNSIEPQFNEALEHWIISDWLADHLEDKGEMVIKNFLGLTIWGRTTSGQCITVDSVIIAIHSDLIKK